MPVFSSDKNEERNGSIFYSVLKLHDGTEQPKHNFFSPNQNQQRQKKKRAANIQKHVVVALVHKILIS
jgi:hypothetical protein